MTVEQTDRWTDTARQHSLIGRAYEYHRAAKTKCTSIRKLNINTFSHLWFFYNYGCGFQIAERTWRTTGRAKFLEGHDIHVLCESPSAWHLLDGYGQRLPGPAPADQSLRAQFNVRMLTVLDLSLTVVQLIQVASSLFTQITS